MRAYILSVCVRRLPTMHGRSRALCVRWRPAAARRSEEGGGRATYSDQLWGTKEWHCDFQPPRPLFYLHALRHVIYAARRLGPVS